MRHGTFSRKLPLFYRHGKSVSVSDTYVTRLRTRLVKFFAVSCNYANGEHMRFEQIFILLIFAICSTKILPKHRTVPFRSLLQRGPPA